MTKEAAMGVRGHGGNDTHLDPVEEAGKMPRKRPKETFELPTLMQTVMVYSCYFILTLFGHLAEFLRKIGLKKSSIGDRELEVR